MRNNLGRVILSIFILLHINLFASTYKWSVEANKKTAYTNEAIYLKYICEYSDNGELYNIEFNPVTDNEKYTIELLSESEKIVEGKKVNSFEFVAFVKEDGQIEFAFDTTMKKTNKDSIQNTVLGRDNADYEEFSQRIIRQDSINIDVKKSSTDLVGEFTLEVVKDKEDLKAYQPYHLEIKLSGSGNFKALKPIEFNIEGVKVFSQKVIKKIKLTKSGYRGSWSQKFAFVSEKNFKIPKLKIEYFNLKDKVKKILVINGSDIKVAKAYKKEELLDAKEEKFELNYDFLYYILTFTAGFLFAKIRFKNVKEQKINENSFKVKIEGVKSLEELMIVLALEDAKKYEKLIIKIENGEMLSLKDAKQLSLINS